MKKIIFLSVLVLTSFAINAQIKFGARVGLNLSNFSGDVDENKILPSFHIGGLVNIPINEMLSVQPEILFSGQGAKYPSGKDLLNYINVPVVVQYNHPSGFYAEVGPQIGILLSAKEKEDGEDDLDIKGDLKSTDISVVIGAGFKTPSGFGAGARFIPGLVNISDYGGSSGGYKLRNMVIAFTVFYLFGGGSK